MAHPGKGKTRKAAQGALTTGRGWTLIIEAIRQQTATLAVVQRSLEDKTPGLLRPLPVPDRPWQHISVDFKEMPADKQGMKHGMCICGQTW